MRCSVCGKNSRFHKSAEYNLQVQIGKKWHTEETGFGPKCSLIQRWQSQLIEGSMEGKPRRIWRVPPTKVVQS